ncbi:MAG: hypothetical protein IT304_02490 [Dehalococcoidia bacterium]|nr:hypothetical protein [Dehalococcoidia bacterium]
MNPSIPVILRTLRQALEEHVIPELDSDFARGQAGQVAVTLDWLATGWQEPLQVLQKGNAAIRNSLQGVEQELDRLALEDDRAQHWKEAAASLRAALRAPAEETAAEREAERARFFAVLDELVVAAGPPVAGAEGTGPLWSQLQQALDALADAETYLGPIPLPPEHWR